MWEAVQIKSSDHKNFSIKNQTQLFIEIVMSEAEKEKKCPQMQHGGSLPFILHLLPKLTS